MMARSCHSVAQFECDNLKRRCHRSKDALGVLRGENPRTHQVRIPILHFHPNSALQQPGLTRPYCRNKDDEIR